MTLKRALVVYRTYAHEKATRLLTRGLLQAGLEIDFICLGESQFSLDERNKICSYNFDILILSCGGRDINKIIDIFDSSSRRPYIVSLFPGIVVQEQLDAYITRLRCDLVLLNSPLDASIYKKVCWAFDVPNNATVFGVSWLDQGTKKTSDNKNWAGITIFFDQLHVPVEEKNKKKLAQMLIQLAKQNQERLFLIKPRNDGLDGSDVGLLSELADFDELPNLLVARAEVGDLINVADSCMSISSSALLEGIIANKSTYVLGDFKSRKNFSTYFKGSGLICNMLEIDFNNPQCVNKSWKSENIVDPRKNIEAVLLKILQETSNKRKVNIFMVFWFRLFIMFPLQFLWHPFLVKKKILNAVSMIRSN